MKSIKNFLLENKELTIEELWNEIKDKAWFERLNYTYKKYFPKSGRILLNDYNAICIDNGNIIYQELHDEWVIKDNDIENLRKLLEYERSGSSKNWREEFGKYGKWQPHQNN